MISTMFCVFFVFIVQKEIYWTIADVDFKPMPIPVDSWHEFRESRANTLHETIITAAPQTIATIPAHYWEDALRHSVYLTLVRDKIDQLIGKGDSLNRHTSKKIDDNDLWNKIKTAPFDRIKADEPVSFGDVTIMSKGRLLEENKGFRFAEDERSKEKCNNDVCMEGVKAFWLVKRVRHRDVEMSPGSYHYELTFSVATQPKKKERQPYENPVRIFTVQESTPEIITGPPLEYRHYELSTHTPRPQRAIWFHKNIIPTTSRYHGRPHSYGLDRIFSSLFEDYDDDVPPQRFRPNPYVQQQNLQYSKVGYAGPITEPRQQKKPYKTQTLKYYRPPLPPPPIPSHHYFNIENDAVTNAYVSQSTDHKYVATSKVTKTPRPAVLPTLPPTVPVFSSTNISIEMYAKKHNSTDITTNAPKEIVNIYNNYKPMPTQMKINYFSENVRPPVYNAPPGIFVNMDKKPFKPMPPLRLIYGPKSTKTTKPLDFRPSPQVLDIQFSEPDPLFDTAFRPITVGYSESNVTDRTEFAENEKLNNKKLRKPTSTSKKPLKKHENIKQRFTTITPDIITAKSESVRDEDTMEWANIVDAFIKTTPMLSENNKIMVIETTTPITTLSTTTSTKKQTTTSEISTETTTTNSTPKPTKRTRPPAKFPKPVKVKKHKRVTTTTKGPTTVSVKSTVSDLIPQASSATTNASKSWWDAKNHILSTSPATILSNVTNSLIGNSSPEQASTTIPAKSSTTRTTIEDIRTTEATSTIRHIPSKNKNRYRQSTLMVKGTSVKHDKWSVNGTENVRKNMQHPGKFSLRRKGSNFRGYVSSSTSSNSDIKNSEEDNEDYTLTSQVSSVSSVTTSKVPETTPQVSVPTYEETMDQYDNIADSQTEHSQTDAYSAENSDETNQREETESQDDGEFILSPKLTEPNESGNEIIDIEEQTTEQILITTPHSVPKNKTKCKKKKNKQNVTNEELLHKKDAPKHTFTLTTTTETTSTSDIFADIFGGFTADDNLDELQKNSKPKSELDNQESENLEQYVKIDDDLEDFLGGLHHQKIAENKKQVENYDEEGKEPSIYDEESSFENEDDTELARDSNDDTYEDYRERPISLLELMAME